MTAISNEAIPAKNNARRTLTLVVLFCALAFIVLGVLAPFINAARFSASIKQALEASLGRRVTFGKVYYRILPVPGFSLEDVTIEEAPSFGLEPFASRTGLEARLRIDKLLTGQIRFASVRLTDPSLNIVKRDDGAWNVVEFVQHMSAPRHSPLNLIPAVQITNGRLDFKFGVRKTTFYITGADISIYPEYSGRVVLNFTGSPARTDRAGNGFGALRGSLNWLVTPTTPNANQLEADVILLPSDLSEITTLVQGNDVGVHGTISSRAKIAGPLNALKVSGDLRLQDVHRWDLLPSSGDDWRVPYDGSVDLVAQHLELRTLAQHPGEVVPAALQVKVNDFLTKPAWTLMTSLNQAPLESLLPLARRMGFAVPADVALTGALNGVVGYSNNTGFLGEVSVQKAVAKLPNIAPIEAADAQIKILPEGLHLEPATLHETGGGTMQVGGDYTWAQPHLAAGITVNRVSIDTLKNTAQAWFGTPPALAALTGGKEGVITGDLHYDNAAPETNHDTAAGWSGQFQFSEATVTTPAVAFPLKHAQGHVTFNPENFDLAHFSATVDDQVVQGSYRYNQTAKRQEHLRLELPDADAAQIAAVLEPAWREPGLLARLPFTKRNIPDWMAARNLEGDLSVAHFRVNKTDLGPLNTHFVWQAANLQVTSVDLRSADVSIKGAGSINLKARVPTARFTGDIAGYRWGGGIVNAQGDLESAGTGSDILRSLHAVGKFSATDLSLSLNEDFEKIAGAFELTFDSGWPKLHLSKVQAVQHADDWSGEALSNSDGQLIFDLLNGDRQLHIVSILAPPASPAVSLSEKLAQK